MARSVLALSFLALVIIPAAGRASVITGVLNFTGTAEISLGNIEFTGNVFSINSPASTQQGGFTALEGTTGTIQNIMNPPDATGPLDVPDFITFADASNITITLTYLLPGIDGAAGCSASPAAAGQVCAPNVPAQSPYNLQNTSATSSSASFEVLGTEVDSTSMTSIPIVGTFTTPFSNLNFQNLLSEVEGGQTITTSFSAEFSTTVAPEPGTLAQLMMGIGMVGASLFCRKNFGKHCSSK